MFRGEAPEVNQGYKKGQSPWLCTCTVRDDVGEWYSHHVWYWRRFDEVRGLEAC